MKCFARHLFTAASALSLLTCIAAAVLWAWSGPLEMVQVRYNRSPEPAEFYAYYFAAASYSDTFSLRFNRRHIVPAYFVGMPASELELIPTYYPPGLHMSVRSQRDMIAASPPLPGFDARHTLWTPRTGFRSDDWRVAFRPWLAIALLLVLPALWLNTRRKVRRARRRGLCPTCGYDLRASPERCPECGRTATTPMPAVNA